ncbi:zinc finger protein [Macleaya cordata]|uniref:S-acyltransferase n=1 Tax=Macleaya cordata TaxID=56857 RepID=A0A200QEC9_MACCD|nr:zinc finger protein [Macleaya cordata]
MRKHGWQLPYHPLQVVAVAVFLALGFAFYVFFVPFVGSRVFQYVLMGLYTPLITCAFCLYIWCAAADPADPGVFKSKKYLNTVGNKKHTRVKESRLGEESTSSMNDANAATAGENATNETEMSRLSHRPSCSMVLLGWFPCALIYNCSRQPEESADQQMSEDGMFYCSLCEVEVYKYSKHCRVCDKCVNHFDHHCRWINNCIGKKNYRQFFTLMLSALILLIIQWLIGILVMICAFVERERFTLEISSKLGSSFSLAPFIVVVASCTILAMIATLPLAQLFFFHVLLIKKGISTYDYIIALREQEQEQQGVEGQQSPPMSLASSRTGLSSGSSFNTFHRGAWCTPPRLFLEDQFDVVPPDTGMFLSSSGKKMVGEEPITKKNPGAVKISPWTLAHLNGEEISKVAAQARKKSKVLQPVVRREASFGLERHNSFGCSSSQMDPRPETQKHSNERVRLPVDLPPETLAKISTKAAESKLNDLLTEASTSLAPLQLEARSAFHTSRALSASTSIVASSPESSLESPDLHPFRVSSSGAEETRELTAQSAAGSSYQKGIPLSRSISDGYEASGGEDSDWVPSRIGHRATNWKN